MLLYVLFPRPVTIRYYALVLNLIHLIISLIAKVEKAGHPLHVLWQKVGKISFVRIFPIEKTMEKQYIVTCGFHVGGNLPYQYHIKPIFGPETIPYHIHAWSISVPYHPVW